MLYTKFPKNFFVSLLGVWEALEGTGRIRPVSGLAYYMSAPISAKEALLDPIHTAVYVVFIVAACATFSKLWIEVSGSSPRDVAKQLKEQQMVMAGHREQSMYKELKRVIPTAAWLSGATIGALAIFSDLLGALGSGTSVLLCTTIIYQFLEQLSKESNNNVAGMADLLGL